MNLLDELNPAQQQAVAHVDGPLLIFAGAGSGKTRVLTYRIAHLIAQGIDPYHILAITFTNKAAKEMRERVNSLTPAGEHVWVSTFHAACTRILRYEAQELGFAKGFSIYDTQDSLRLIKECVKEMNLDEVYYPARFVAQSISAQKNELITPHEYARSVAGDYRRSNVAEIYARYQKRLAEMNALDFDDIIFRTVELLKTNEAVREKYQRRFQYVMVDEYQDTNHAQYQLVNLLAGFAGNLCVVGDDDQSIYGWRGANVENILRFENDYKGTKVIKLEENYRSTQTILDAANDVISNNLHRASKRLWTQNTRGQDIRVYLAHNERDEGAFVARLIKEEVAQQRASYSDFAILYRANAQSRGVEDALVSVNVPYRIFGGVRFYDHTEVKDMLAYLKAINNPTDDVAHLRIINVPKRGIGAASISKVQGYALQNSIPFAHAMGAAAEVPGLGKKAVPISAFAGYLAELAAYAANATVASIIQKIIRDTNFLDNLADGTLEGDERVANVMELLATANLFEKESEDKSLGKFLEDVALVADIDNYHETTNAVSLMTLHSAKGLEFNTVFMVGFEEYLFPSSRSIESGQEHEMEEERRLCYVGFTRARRALYLTHATSRMRYDKVARNAPSRFLSEVDPSRLTAVNTRGLPKEFVSSALSGQNYHAATRTAARPAIKNNLLPPTKISINFTVGDTVRMAKYGVGHVLEIRNAGADYEVTIDFEEFGRKKFMANLLKVAKNK